MVSQALLFERLKPLVFLLCLIPFAMAIYRLFEGYYVEPVEELTALTGQWTLRFLLIGLAITPIRQLLNVSALIKWRRMIGLYAFFYGCIHITIYLVLDRELIFSTIWTDIVKRTYITVGFAAFILLIPLAITSTNKMIKRVGGKRWVKLHKLVYFSTLLACLHFLWLVKSDITEPAIYIAIFLTLMLYRFYKKIKSHGSSRQSIKTS